MFYSHWMNFLLNSINIDTFFLRSKMSAENMPWRTTALEFIELKL